MTVAVLSSPRRRRRAAWLGAVVAVAAAIAALVVLAPSRSPAVEDTAAPAASEAPAQVVKEPPTVPAPRREIDALLDAFIPAVIERRDLRAGWDLVTSDARGSRSDWMRGETPFQHFQARDRHFRGWQVNYSYRGDVGFDVFVAPKNPNSISMAFRGEAKKVDGRWRIAVFYPQATFQPAGKKQFVFADTDLQPQAVGSASTTSRLSAAWLLLPVGLIGGTVAAALAVALVRAARRRARVREIERDLAALRHSFE